ncbi:symmetrical bis(5'-nucleosyl)-tetraphosphatase [Thalassotalea fusca]
MATYFIGDIQGCYSELRALMERVAFSPATDELWVAGDMVARGPQSLETLQYLMSLGDSVKSVLGNHDLHLLSVIHGLKPEKKQDKLSALLASSELESIVHWLVHQPLLRKLPNENVYMSHAGIAPQWTIDEATASARFAEEKLQSKHLVKWLSRMYGEMPNDWHQVRTKTEKFRYTINAFTRMRYCYDDLTLEFACKQGPSEAPPNIKPWYFLSTDVLKNNQWIFGHWAALMGNCPVPNTYPLDTGCVWGGSLTLLRWDDKQYFVEPAHKKTKIKQ